MTDYQKALKAATDRYLGNNGNANLEYDFISGFINGAKYVLESDELKDAISAGKCECTQANATLCESCEALQAFESFKNSIGGV